MREGGLYAIQPVGLAGEPIKIGYAHNLLQRLAAWHYAYPQGIKILAVARMNRRNNTHFSKRRVLQLAGAALKYGLKHDVVARDEWMHPSTKGKILETMRRLQRSRCPKLKEHFCDFSPVANIPELGLLASAAPCHSRRKTVPLGMRTTSAVFGRKRGREAGA